ncbi:serine/threonine-protein kinase [Gammaproteobacteria bacterium]|nr:serine/threonine-protein kinase [Gammaproteobacteria bacterium]
MTSEAAVNHFSLTGYVIHRELGRGGIATVYLAVQESLRREVALKVMAPALTTDPNFTDRFLHEGRTIAQLNHPGIVTIHDISVDEHQPYIAMEYLKGGSLKQRLKDRVPVQEALDILYQIASALEYAHDKGIVHRDVKPENIMFRDDEGTEAVLTDFGIAKSESLQSEFTSAGMVVGTPRYMSPEQAEGRAASARSDIYALGIILYEMLTGLPPYGAGESMAVLYSHINDPIPELPRRHRDLQPLFADMVAKDPQQRLADCTALLERLEEHVTEPADASPSVNTGPGRGMDAPAASTSIVKRLRALGANFVWGGIALASVIVISTVIWGLMLPGSGKLSEFELTEGETPVIFAPKKIDLTLVEPSPQIEQAQADDREKIQVDIDALLALADRQIRKDRLSTPIGNNAVDTFSAILKKHPGNPDAERGLRRVADRYEELARAQLREKDFLQADELARTGLVAWSEHDRLKIIRQEIHSQAARASQLRKQATNNGSSKEKYPDPIKSSISAAKNGNSEVQFQLALALANGDGVERDFNEALRWLEAAASSGHAVAQYNLGLGSLFGPDPAPPSAGKWVKSAADQDYKPAYRVLGWMYTTGTGIKRNAKQAVVWSVKGTKWGKPPNSGDVVAVWQASFEDAYHSAVIEVREQKRTKSQDLK